MTFLCPNISPYCTGQYYVILDYFEACARHNYIQTNYEITIQMVLIQTLTQTVLMQTFWEGFCYSIKIHVYGSCVLLLVKQDTQIIISL